MATKKKVKVTKKPISDEPTPLTLTQLELLKMEKLHAVIRAAKSEALQLLSLKRAFLIKIDPKNELAGYDYRITNLGREQQEAEKELQELQKSVEARLDIDLKEYAYDDLTGTLKQLPRDPSPPQEPTKKE